VAGRSRGPTGSGRTVPRLLWQLPAPAQLPFRLMWLRTKARLCRRCCAELPPTLATVASNRQAITIFFATLPTAENRPARCPSASPAPPSHDLGRSWAITVPLGLVPLAAELRR